MLSACSPGGNLPSFNTAPGFPSDADPSGVDALSSSTNRKPGAGVPDVQADPLAGAAFIGTPAVNNYGTVSFSYPLEIPEGRAGLTPQVTLSCNSAKGDGLCGAGWTLAAGGGSITRTSRSGQPVYGPGDIFTYNGKRLIKVTSGQEEDGDYRLETGDDLSLFTLSDSINGGVWTMRDSSGNTTIFGRDLSSRIYHPDDAAKTFCWNFSLIQDLNGNYLEAVYDNKLRELDRVLYLRKLHYTGHEPSGTEPRQWVRFSYRERREPYVSSAPGFILRMSRLLDEITVGWDGPSGEEPLWHYKMIYETGEDSSRPLLRTVESDRTGTAPEFSYNTSEHNLLWKQAANSFVLQPEKAAKVKYFEGDFNGDALSDMVFFDPDTGLWRAAEARRGGGYSFPVYGEAYRGFGTESQIQFFKSNVTGDFNGDGRSDIAFFLPGTGDYIVAEHNGKVFEFKNYGRLISPVKNIMCCEWFTGDYDGNGLSDALLFYEPAGEWTLMLNKGGRFEFQKVARNFKNLFRSDYSPGPDLNCDLTFDSSEAGLSRRSVHFFEGDFTGSGRSDISIYDSRSGAWYVGEAFRDTHGSFTLSWKLFKRFTAPENLLLSNDRFCGDFNSDGRSDFLLFDRSRGTWTLGETGDGSIIFRTFSTSPQFRDITRFVQGDFNGDGRTDIGFFSAADNKLWVGETTPDGFRYRIYSDGSDCPGIADLTAAPCPADEVIISNSSAIIPGIEKTYRVNYIFDSNAEPGRGERAFPGSFTSAGSPEILYWRRTSAGALQSGFYLQSSGGEARYLGGTDIDLDRFTVLNRGRALHGEGGDCLLLYEHSGESHSFLSLSVRDSQVIKENIASFSEEEIPSFEIGSSVYQTGKFYGNSDRHNEILMLDNGSDDVPAFVLCSSESEPRRLEIDSTGSLTADDLVESGGLHFFTAESSSGKTTLFVCDSREDAQLWHRASIDEGIYSAGNLEISFSLCSSVAGLDYSYDGEYYPCTDGFWYRAGVTLRQIVVEGSGGYTSLSLAGSYSLSDGQEFRGEFDHTESPILRDGSGLLRLVNFRPEPFPASAVSELDFSRPGLYKEFYPYQWIQGDYNGDGKTDIGIFSITDPQWHFALSSGTVPDLPVKVQNGTGGVYRFEYANSSGFDNTGDDDIPDLPVNYRVCTKMTVSDGAGNEVVTKYGYSGGYAFSRFIDGFRETDFFGFGKFTVTDALGGKQTFLYHNTPYSNFLWNRALAGALKQKTFTGADGVEYRREDYSYRIHELGESGQQQKSCVAENSLVDTFRDGVLFESTEAEMRFTETGYSLVSKTGRVIDRFADGVHSQSTDTTLTEFETDETTNTQVVKLRKEHAGSENETAARFTYDFNFNPVTEETEYTGGVLQVPAPRRIFREFDIYGNVISETDRSGSPERKTAIEYDSELHQFVRSKTVSAPEPLTTRFEYDYGSAFGKVTCTSGPGSQKSFTAYDSLGRISSQSGVISGEKRRLAEFVYRHDAFPLSAHVTLFTGSGDPDIEKAVYGDGCGRVLHSVKSAGNGRHVKSGLTSYDALGRVTRKGRADWCSADELKEYHPHRDEKHPTLTEYDYAGRAVKITLPETSPDEGPAVTSLEYSYGNPWIVTERTGRRARTTITNSRGLMLYVTDSGTGDDGKFIDASMGFAYDQAGRRVKRMDLNSSSMNAAVDPSLFRSGARDSSGSCISQWRYDGFGRLVDTSCPDTGYTRFEYNAFRENSAVIDARGLRSEMDYDCLGRLAERRAPSHAGPEVIETTRFIYGGAESPGNTAGRLSAVIGPFQRKDFCYDETGSVIRETRTFTDPLSGDQPGIAFTTGFEYDLQGRLTAVDYPRDPRTASGIRAEYTLGAAGAESVLIISSGKKRNVIERIAYSEDGQLESIERGNGTESTYTYDSRGRLAGILSTTESNAVTRKLEDVSYTLRNDNSVASIVNFSELRPGGVAGTETSHRYSYDGLNRLIAAEGVLKSSDSLEARKYSHSYGYTANGNMTSRSASVSGPEGTRHEEMTCSYSGGGHALTGISSASGGSVMRYDASGNMVFQSSADDGTRRLEYDASSRIRLVIDDTSGIAAGEYRYDEQGFRIRKLITDTAGKSPRMEVLSPSMYFALEQSVPDGLHDSPGTMCSVNHVYLNGIRIAAVAANGDARFYLTDHLDSVKLVVDNNGLPVSKTEYLPFGGSWFSEGAAKYLPKFNSQETDRESGLIFFNARHYDAAMCRFVTADSVVPYEDDTQSWNRYSYCRNNPAGFGDPSGNVFETLWDAASIGAGVTELIDSIKYGSGQDIALCAGAIVVDSLAAAVPFVPGGAGIALKASRAAGKKLAAEVAKQAAKKAVKVEARASTKIADAYSGVKQASKYLQDSGVNRDKRKEIIESFNKETIVFRKATDSEYGIRYYDGIESFARGRYLFETFPASRQSLAIKPKWNSMKLFKQWKVKEGTPIIQGISAPQGKNLPGGQIQKYINNPLFFDEPW